jgi:hypothetical protein
MTHHIRFAAGSFHFIERPQFFGTGFQPCPDPGPLKALMAVHAFLKPGFQCREKFFTLFWGQLLFIAGDFVHTFTSSASNQRFSDRIQIFNGKIMKIGLTAKTPRAPRVLITDGHGLTQILKTAKSAWRCTLCGGQDNED